MRNTLKKLISGKLMRRSLPNRLQDQMQERRKAAKARMEEKRRHLRGDQDRPTRRLGQFLLGALSGAALMYFLDPRGGGRRRALLRDKLVRLRHEGEDALETVGTTGGQVRDRARGAVAETQGRIKERLSDEAIPDTQLEARVRSELGRYVRHLGAIDIRASNGTVTLSGPALAHEVEELIKYARGVRGVQAIENKLTVFEKPEDIPALQG